jgi:hypothetical protein
MRSALRALLLSSFPRFSNAPFHFFSGLPSAVSGHLLLSLDSYFFNL